MPFPPAQPCHPPPERPLPRLLSILAALLALGTAAIGTRSPVLTTAGAALSASYGAEMAEVTGLVNDDVARETFRVDGSGLAVAIIDTGLRISHVDFAGDRIPFRHDFLTDDDDVTDTDGHGTHAAGIVGANGIHRGIAPGVQIIPLKVDRDGIVEFDAVRDALEWVLEHREIYNIAAVNLSLEAVSNQTSFEDETDVIAPLIRELREAGVPCLSSAGNGFFTFDSAQGMDYPGIIPEMISVGAVYDADVGRLEHPSGAVAIRTGPKRICAFSQRLSQRVGGVFATDFFAPGAIVTSTGIENDRASLSFQGTSECTPVVTGIILLLQEYYLRARGVLPTVEDLERWLLAGSSPIEDGDDEKDNVENTGETFRLVNAFRSLEALVRELEPETFSIEGRVKLKNRGMGGVLVRAGIKSATTSASGRYRITGLAAGDYTVIAAKECYEFSPASRLVTLGPSKTVNFTARLERRPRPPTNLKGKALSPTEINLKWRDRGETEDGFLIEQKVGNRFNEIGRVDADVTEVNIRGAQPATQYQFRVRAFNCGGKSPPSNVAVVRTPE